MMICNQFQQPYLRSDELNEMLQSPVYKDEDKKEALNKIFVNQSDTTKSLIATLITNKRASFIKRGCNKLYRFI